METQPIIIKRKKAVHAHHGGAWKVAYADFVTALMALFIVLWLLSSSEKVRQAVGGYFMDPNGAGKQTGTGMAGTGESLSIAEKDMHDLKEKLEDAIKSIPQLKNMQDQVKITITGEGLRIELLESDTGTFFESGRGKPNENCVALLSRLAGELGKLKNTIILEGHTDAKAFSGSTTYTNWDLSSDRANAARGIMQATGLRPDQVAQVRGFADQELRRKDDPFHASNRRISVIVQYKNLSQQIALAEVPHTKEASHTSFQPSLHPYAATVVSLRAQPNARITD
jgi:chemotaxis protein MotB